MTSKIPYISKILWFYDSEYLLGLSTIQEAWKLESKLKKEQPKGQKVGQICNKKLKIWSLFSLPFST